MHIWTIKPNGEIQVYRFDPLRYKQSQKHQVTTAINAKQEVLKEEKNNFTQDGVRALNETTFFQSFPCGMP